MTKKVKLVGSITYFKSLDTSGLVLQHIPSYTIFTIPDDSWASALNLLQRGGGNKGLLTESDVNLLETKRMLPLKLFLFQNGLLKEVHL